VILEESGVIVLHGGFRTPREGRKRKSIERIEKVRSKCSRTKPHIQMITAISTAEQSNLLRPHKHLCVGPQKETHRAETNITSHSCQTREKADCIATYPSTIHQRPEKLTFLSPPRSLVNARIDFTPGSRTPPSFQKRQILKQTPESGVTLFLLLGCFTSLRA